MTIDDAGQPLRSLAGVRLFCDKNDSDDTGSDRKKLSLDEILRLATIEKPQTPLKLRAQRSPMTSFPKIPDIDAKTVRAAEKVAAVLEGDVRENIDNLLGQLKDVSTESRETLDQIFTGMKIDRESGRPTHPFLELQSLDVNAKENQAISGEREAKESDRSVGVKKQPAEPRRAFSMELFSGPRLGKFSAGPRRQADKEPCCLPVWDRLEKREIQSLLETRPRNGFEEMIQWTEQGTLWPFPIDNEYGMDEEAKISFEEHVFLDHLIEDEEVFPEGPIKHFMDLVCTGLSKNPYITVERKHKCIEWYRDYFRAKKAIIKAAVAE